MERAGAGKAEKQDPFKGGREELNEIVGAAFWSSCGCGGLFSNRGCSGSFNNRHTHSFIHWKKMRLLF